MLKFKFVTTIIVVWFVTTFRCIVSEVVHIAATEYSTDSRLLPNSYLNKDKNAFFSNNKKAHIFEDNGGQDDPLQQCLTECLPNSYLNTEKLGFLVNNKKADIFKDNGAENGQGALQQQHHAAAKNYPTEYSHLLPNSHFEKDKKGFLLNNKHYDAASISTTVAITTITYYVTNGTDTPYSNYSCQPDDMSTSCNLREAWYSCQVESLLNTSTACNIIILPETNIFYGRYGSLILDKYAPRIFVKGPERGSRIVCADCTIDIKPPEWMDLRGFPVFVDNLHDTNNALQNVVSRSFLLCENNIVELSSCGNTVYSDTFFRLYNSDGVQVAYSDDDCSSGGSHIVFEATASCQNYTLAMGCYSARLCFVNATGRVYRSPSVEQVFLKYSGSSVLSSCQLDKRLPYLRLMNIHFESMNRVLRISSFINLQVRDSVVNTSSNVEGGAFSFSDMRANYYNTFYEYLQTNTIIDILNCSFLNTVSLSSGGAISAKNSTNFHFHSSVFNNCSAMDGGAVYFNYILLATLQNCSFLSCRAASSGGSVIVTSSYQISFTGVNFLDSIAMTSGGGAIYFLSYNSNMKIANSTFVSCHSRGNGGAVGWYANNNYFYMLSNTFFGCSAGESGGALFFGRSNSRIFFQEDAFDGCVAEKDGGAIFLEDSNNHFSLYKVTIRNNIASLSGGGIFLQSNNDFIVLAGCIIENNIAGETGGGIAALEGNDQVIITEEHKFSNCWVSKYQLTCPYQMPEGVSGILVMFSMGSTIDIPGVPTLLEITADSDTIFSTSVDRFPGVHIPAIEITAEKYATVTVRFSIFSKVSVDNYASCNVYFIPVYTSNYSTSETHYYGDDAYYESNSTFYGSSSTNYIGTSYHKYFFQRMRFENNSALSRQGGALYFYYNNRFPIILNTDFVGNRASGAIGMGGAIYFWTMNNGLVVYNSLFEANIATMNGGSVALVSAHAAVKIGHSDFFKSAAGNLGGCIYLGNGNGQGLYKSGNEVSFVDNIMHMSSARFGGGLYFLSENQVVLRDNIILECMADMGGGLYVLSENTVTLSRAFFMRNNATYHGGGIFSFNDNSMNFELFVYEYNSVFAENEAGVFGGGYHMEGGSIVRYILRNDTNKMSDISKGSIFDAYAYPYLSVNVADDYIPTIATVTMKGNKAGLGGGGCSLYRSSLPSYSVRGFVDASANGLFILNMTENEALYGSAYFLYELPADSVVLTSESNLASNLQQISHTIFSKNKATFGGTLYWLYDPSSSLRPRISLMECVFADNSVGYGEIATQVVYLTTKAKQNVTVFDSAFEPAVEVKLYDFYTHQVNSRDGEMVVSAEASSNAGAFSCDELRPSVSSPGELGTTVPVISGVANFTDLFVTCAPKGHMIMRFTSAVMSPLVPISGSAMQIDPNVFVASTSSVFTFRECRTGEYLENGRCILCPKGSYSLDVGSGRNSIKQCISCVGKHGVLDCHGDQIQVAPGYWRRTELSQTVLECPMGADGCLGGWVTGESSCAEGYTGALCAVCSSGYYRSGGICLACVSHHQKRNTALVVAVFGIVALLLVALYMCRHYIYADVDTLQRKLATMQRQVETNLAKDDVDAEESRVVGSNNNDNQNQSGASRETDINHDKTVYSADGSSNNTNAGETKTYMNSLSMAPVVLSPVVVSISSGQLVYLWLRKCLKEVTVKAKIFASTFQVITNSAAVFAVTMPSNFTRFVSSMQFININIYSVLPVGCSSENFNYITELLWITLSPLFLLAVAVILLGFIYFYLKYSDRYFERSQFSTDWPRWKERGILFYFYLSYLILPVVSVKIFRMFICQNVDPLHEDNEESDSFLVADMRISCTSSYYHRCRDYAIVMIILYPIGIPLSYLAMLYRYKEEIQNRPVPDKGNLAATSNDSQKYAPISSVQTVDLRTSLNQAEDITTLKVDAVDGEDCGVAQPSIRRRTTSVGNEAEASSRRPPLIRIQSTYQPNLSNESNSPTRKSLLSKVNRRVSTYIISSLSAGGSSKGGDGSGKEPNMFVSAEALGLQVEYPPDDSVDQVIDKDNDKNKGKEMHRINDEGIFVADIEAQAKDNTVIANPSMNQSQQKRVEGRMSRTVLALAFLWASYEPIYWYWEVVEAGRRIMLTAVLSVSAPGTSSQNVLSLILSLLFIKVYAYYQPFMRGEDDVIAEVGQFQIFFTYFGAMVQQNDLLPAGYSHLLGALLIIVNLILPIVICYYLFYRNFDTARDKSKEVFSTLSQSHKYLYRFQTKDKDDDIADDTLDKEISVKKEWQPRLKSASESFVVVPSDGHSEQNEKNNTEDQ